MTAVNELEIVARQWGEKAADSYRRHFGEPPDRRRDGYDAEQWAKDWGGMREIRELGAAESDHDALLACWLRGFFGE